MTRWSVSRLRSGGGVGFCALATVFAWSKPALAVPSFSRQTGLACNVCHSNPPELTAFGRRFKLEAYSLTAKPEGAVIEAPGLQLPRAFPLSVMILLGTTATNTAVPGAQQLNTQFPQALSLFLAGAIAPHFGAMVQATYSHQGDHFGLDNTDIRYADHTKLGPHDLLYGITLNNGPTVEDVWNSTPAWGFPWLSANNTPAPGAMPIISGALAQDVAGLGAYALWNDHLYAGVTLYRSEHAGGAQPLDGKNSTINIYGAALYWRVAWQQTLGTTSLEVGSYGIHLGSTPGTVGGPRDVYTDVGFDLQLEHPIGKDLLTLHATYVHESSSLDATFASGGATEPAHHLNLYRADATYHFLPRYTLTVGGYTSNGSSDPVLLAPGPVSGSATGAPDSSALIAQAGFWPVQNVELLVAGTAYGRFNGGTGNYDGSGRSASDNDSLYFALWINY